MKKVILAGGTGFIGEYFQKRFEDLGYEVHVISRRNGNIQWQDQKGIVEALEGADMLINLAGKSVNCRYNTKNKNEIMISRVVTTNILGEAVQKCSAPPEVWMNSSTATIYRHADDKPMTEEGGEIGTGFSVNVATNWEDNFFALHTPGTRKVALRTAIVLGKHGGVMTPYENLVKFGLGGPQGSGKQMFSWIHVEDLYRVCLFIEDNKQLEGVFNCAAPNPVSNEELMRLLRERSNRSFGLPAPKWVLEIGSALIRTESELVLKSRWVVPARLEESGFTFQYPTLESTLEEILEK
ncbi:TIGR01777 family oxidoreductase [Halobacillus sp. GSS1]|uniref:TIGR01777 family oxidoreductase n=1 Tax=Halobacillus sp. GSS1 TaxID=2815919 RepID=UPI001A8EB494|nr:TIGR01777 family oxidoreductase [Halobacillus sp. GSS1]